MESGFLSSFQAGRGGAHPGAPPGRAPGAQAGPGPGLPLPPGMLPQAFAPGVLPQPFAQFAMGGTPVRISHNNSQGVSMRLLHVFALPRRGSLAMRDPQGL